MTQTIETEALVIGAGPVGMYQAFQLGLLEIETQIVDALPVAGGQPAEIYPGKPIYDLPGIPACTGEELASALLTQIEPLGQAMHLGQTVEALERQADGRFLVGTRQGLSFLTRVVVLAAGIGAFEPKRLKLDGLERMPADAVRYRVPPSVMANTRGHVVIIGGEDQALEAAIELAEQRSDQSDTGSTVTLVHRRDGFKADEATVARFRDLCDSGAIHFQVGQATAFECGVDGRLETLEVTDPEMGVHLLALNELWVLQGLSPKLGPVAQWSLAMERKQLLVDVERFQTSEAGIYAVGDVITYPGKRKLLVCGFHEAVMAAFAVATQLRPDQPPQLQYTTTSPRLHELLGR
ncbi:NAD(P)/FAD-dependent oxidoreductase [Hydrogenophaga sp. 5NK40-0174]|uniref:NAD(P)/FAD-dependent oxidoreductase n=1 Tax=Hydrogenophaga sp. 5NK40-0174 TaxID=3127649 RepID=UPI0031075CCA